MEALIYIAQNRYLDELGDLLPRQQIPSSREGYASPRLIVAMYVLQYIDEEKEEEVRPLTLLPQALRHCGIVPIDHLNKATPANTLNRDGIYCLLSETSAIILARGPWPAGKVGDLSFAAQDDEPDFFFNIETAGDPELRGVDAGAIRDFEMARRAAGWINQFGAPPENPMLMKHRVPFYDGRWVDDGTLTLLRNPDVNHKAQVLFPFGVCKESGCMVMGDESCVEHTDELERMLYPMAHCSAVMHQDPEFKNSMTKGFASHENVSFVTRWWQGFNGQVLAVAKVDGVWVGRQTLMHVCQTLSEDSVLGFYRRGLMEESNPNSEFSRRMRSFPGIPSMMCRWPSERQANSMHTLEPKRYQVRSGYGHPRLWEASMLAYTGLLSEFGYEEKEIFHDGQEKHLMETCLNTGDYAETLGPISSIYLAPGLAQAFQNTDAPLDCTVAEMGLPYRRMRIMLPQGFCQLKNEFGVCDAHSVHLTRINHKEAGGDFLMIAAACEGTGGTQLFFEIKPWATTIGGMLLRTSPRRLDFNLKSRYADLGKVWNAAMFDDEFSKIAEPHPPSEEEEIFWRDTLSLAAQALLTMTMKPEWVTPEFQERKEKIKRGVVVRDAIWQPNILGANYQIKSEGAQRPSSEGDAGHATPRFHWRRGHWRNQAHGEGRTLRRFVWLEPMAIGLQD